VEFCRQQQINVQTYYTRRRNIRFVLYSIIETAKANDLNVFEYVMSCLDEFSKPAPNIEQLLPWHFAKP
jgi:transposase